MVDWNGHGTLPMLFSRSATGAVSQWLCWVEGDEVVVRWGYMGGQQQDTRYKCEPKNVGRSNETTAEEQAIREALAKWKKQKKRKYYENAEEAETLKRLRPMLAQKFSERKDKVHYPVDVQPKLNGVRCLAFRRDGKVFLQSRGGDPYSVDHISNILEPYLPDNLILDGELYYHGHRLQEIISYVKRPQPLSLTLQYHLYDCVWEEAQLTPSAMPWLKRRQYLISFMQHVHSSSVEARPYIQEVPTYLAETEEVVMSLHDFFADAKYEGAIVRAHHGTYRFGFKSPHLLKVKAFQDDEFLVIGVSVGRGKAINVPIFKCRTKDGATFDVNPEGTDEERAAMLADAKNLIGKMYTVKFLEYSKDGVPLHPTGVAFRGDEDR